MLGKDVRTGYRIAIHSNAAFRDEIFFKWFIFWVLMISFTRIVLPLFFLIVVMQMRVNLCNEEENSSSAFFHQAPFHSGYGLVKHSSVTTFCKCFSCLASEPPPQHTHTSLFQGDSFVCQFQVEGIQRLLKREVIFGFALTWLLLTMKSFKFWLYSSTGIACHVDQGVTGSCVK